MGAISKNILWTLNGSIAAILRCKKAHVATAMLTFCASTDHNISHSRHQKHFWNEL